MRVRVSIPLLLGVAAPLWIGAATASAPPAASAVAGSDTPREWIARFTESDGTDLEVRMTVEIRDDRHWTAYSRPGAALQMIPWYQRILGTLLRKLPPHNALIAIAGETRGSADSVVLRGALESPFLGARAFVGSLHAGKIHAELRWGSDSGAVSGWFDATPSTRSGPLRNYRTIADEISRQIDAVVYNPALARSRDYQRFFNDLRAAFDDAHDDLDAVAAFYARQPGLHSSHYNFIRNPKLAATPLDSIIAGDATVDPNQFVTVSFPGPGLANLYIRKWDRVGPAIDRAFARIDSARSTVLMLDIRSNPGGDATAGVPASHLFSDTTTIGVFVARRWFATHAQLPTARDFASLPSISPSGAIHLFDSLRTAGAVVGRIAPASPRFDGRVLVLIDHRTGSASEPLAYLLKSTHRATIIGERSAGAMLTALPHPVGEGFILTVPEADYYAADGTRLEGHGVEPDISASSGDALIAAGNEVKRSLPYAGAVWLGYSYTTLRRFDDAERAWRDALALAPSSAARDFVTARIAAVARARSERR